MKHRTQRPCVITTFFFFIFCRSQRELEAIDFDLLKSYTADGKVIDTKDIELLQIGFINRIGNLFVQEAP